jgi:MFS family permease
MGESQLSLASNNVSALLSAEQLNYFFRFMAHNDSRLIGGFTKYQWLVLFAAWLGWGFDVFDALLFNYVARLCIPSLLGPGHSDPQTITLWTGILTSILLVGWGIGGILFGMITDKIGRSKAMLITMLTYAGATALCAFAPTIEVLIVLRFIASIGIGGEWAAGASLVAETVPENKRVHAGALLYTAAPAGLFLATFVTDLFTRQLDSIASNPDLSWRVVFLTGLIPAAIAFVIRLKVKEPDSFVAAERAPSIRELFTPELRKNTLGGLTLASIALITWWSCNAFIPSLVSFFVNELPLASDPAVSLAQMKGEYVKWGTTTFNLGGLVGTLLTIPIALRLGRRAMFLLYFAASAVTMYVAFGVNFTSDIRIWLLFLVGIPVFGIFGAFTFYLPELFPMRLRATGSGFCYNTGRFITAGGPFIVGSIAQSATSSADILQVISWVAIVPALGVCLVLLGVGVETGRART